MKIFKKLLIVTGVTAIVASSCVKSFDGLLDNPNSPLPSDGDPDLYVNTLQLAFPNYYDALQSTGAELTRIGVFFGPNYQNGYGPSGFNGIWSTAYTSIVKNADALLAVSAQRRLSYHAGMAYIFKAYTMMTMVDLFGDVPYSEANKGNSNTNPKLDPGASVYTAADIMLDSAIANLSRTPALLVANDLYYGQESNATNGIARRTRWITLARTLKLRIALNMRLTNAAAATTTINNLLTLNDFIDTDAEDFTFRYSTRLDNPNSRHPRYNDGYRATGGAGGYIGTYYLHAVANEKAFADPRRAFYFYRQGVPPGTQAQQPCAYNAKPGHYSASDPYCYTGSWWGRDHGDNSGISPDGLLRTVWGVYPAGGKFDDASITAVGLNEGGRGAGIHPIWMSWFTDFSLMEAGIALPGVNLTATQERALFIGAINKSMNRVLNFGPTIGVTIPAANLTLAQTRQATYLTNMGTQWDATTTDAQKLDLGLKEYYLSLFGNGAEAYNMYRRTSRPRNLQPTLVNGAGTFIRSMFYPADFANLNTNGTQKANMAVKVFWDTNPDPLF